MKIIKYWDHSREKWAERCVGKDLDDEVDVEGVEDECAVVHDEKEKGNAAQPGENRKEGGCGNRKIHDRKRRSDAYHVRPATCGSATRLGWTE